MLYFSEQPFAAPSLSRSNSMRPGLVRQGSGLGRSTGSPSPGQALRKSMGAVAAAAAATREEGSVDVGGKNPPTYKLETSAACQLVAFIYEQKVQID